MTKRKVLSAKEIHEQEVKRMLRNPRTNPESIYNRIHLVTGHIGGRCFVYYHGNNINVANEIMWMRTRKPLIKRPGMKNPPSICKLWTLTDIKIQTVEA